MALAYQQQLYLWPENYEDEINFAMYDHIIVCMSGGKDSWALILKLIELGVPREKIEIWHHKIDGCGPTFYDWECTESYNRALAAALNIPIYFSWKHGGFKREMLRKNSLTAPTTFQMPDPADNGDVIECTFGGIRGDLNTRRKFPQVSGNIKHRWCSSLKIDPGCMAVRRVSSKLSPKP